LVNINIISSSFDDDRYSMIVENSHMTAGIWFYFTIILSENEILQYLDEYEVSIN